MRVVPDFRDMQDNESVWPDFGDVRDNATAPNLATISATYMGK
jgi:hypothetical protein